MGSTQVFCAHAKCTLVGEHSVLRGFLGLVTPVLDYQIIIRYTPDKNKLRVNFHEDINDVFMLFFHDTLKRGLNKVNRDYGLTGTLYVENTIPMGVGLGSSAALCAVVTELIFWYFELNSELKFAFAMELEQNFHGQSSGIDIAGAIHEDTVIYAKGNKVETLHASWEPKLYLSCSNEFSLTANAIVCVNALLSENPGKYQSIDKRMDDSTQLAIEALRSTDNTQRFKQLTQAFDLALHCFHEWGLISDNKQTYLEKLRALGAVALKPTGAGNGGYVLSLWRDVPPKTLLEEMIPVKIV